MAAILKITNLKEKLIAIFAIVLVAVILWLLKVPCVFKALFNIECIGCGMTRAFLSAIKLDFVSAFSYHKMFWSLPVLVLYFLLDGKLFKNKVINITVLILIGIGFLLNWAF